MGRTRLKGEKEEEEEEGEEEEEEVKKEPNSKRKVDQRIFPSLPLHPPPPPVLTFCGFLMLIVLNNRT